MDALTRSDVVARGRSRSWGMVALCLVCAGGDRRRDLVLAAGHRSRRRPRNKRPAQPIPVVVATAERTRRADLAGRAGHGTGVLYRHDPYHGRWAAGRGGFQGRPGRAQGRRAGAGRSAHLPGGAGPGDGEEGTGRGAARQCPGRSGALPEAGRHELHHGTAGRHAEGAGGAAGGAGAAGPGADRHRADTAELLHHRLADRRTDGHSAGRSRATSCTRSMPPGWW